VTYQAWLRGVPRKAWNSAAREAIGRVDLASRADDRMGRLSGGMRQRAGIAGAIVGNPDIIILDEPTVGLDPSQRIEFRDALASLDGASILLSTHLIEDVSATAERIVVLNEGRIVHDGSTSALREQGVERAGVSRLEDAYLSTLGPSVEHA
jgi:ABC-2 type transport system ATP-binding protein